MDWRRLITVDRAVAHGQAYFTGTRIPASVVLDNLAAGLQPEENLESYPSLSHEAIQAAIACACGAPPRRCGLPGVPPLPAFIRTIPTDIHLAANCASELFVVAFGDRGKHDRTSIGMAELLLSVPFEVEVTAVLE